MREIAPADQSDRAVDDGHLAMVPLLQVLQRGHAGDRPQDAELDPGAFAEAVEHRIAHAERTVKAVQRIDDDAHGDATRAGRGQRRLDRAADVVVQRHVDLEVDALAARRDRVEQPATRLRVVELELDPVAGHE